MSMLEGLLNDLLSARAEDRAPKVAKTVSDLAALWEGSEASVTPILTTPSGSHWFPALGIEVSADLREVRQCSVTAMLDKIKRNRSTSL